MVGMQVLYNFSLVERRDLAVIFKSKSRFILGSILYPSGCKAADL